MRIIRALVPILGLVLVFQGTLAVLPHDHGCASAPEGDALGAPSAAEVHRGCLACSAHAPAAVEASAASTLDCANLRSVVFVGRVCESVVAETSAFNPRGPPPVV